MLLKTPDHVRRVWVRDYLITCIVQVIKDWRWEWPGNEAITLYVAHSDSELRGNHYHGEIQLSSNYNFIVFIHACRN